LAANVVHWPVADSESCLNCHNPHASAEGGLLLHPEKELCESCHADVAARADRSRVQHAPVAEGACGTCHAPHGAEAQFLFASADSQELCGACHDWQGHTAHPIGDGVVDMRNPNLEVDCLSCHRSHGSPHEHLATFDIKADLCVDCHERFRR
jgi:predicted CXXCH cytochrome family protein